MAFVNELVPKEQRREITIPNYKTFKPSSWTIDKERDIILYNYWTNIDEPNEEYFALVTKDSVIKVRLWCEVEHPDIVKWSLLSLDIPRNCLPDNNTVRGILREALQAYGMSGFEFGDSEPIETIIKF